MIPDGLFVLDADGIIQHANAAVLALLGLPAPNSSSITEWLSDLDDQTSSLLSKAIQERGQIRFHLHDREYKNLSFQAKPLVDTGGTLCFVRRDCDAETAEVISTLVHDMRTPVTTLTGCSRLLKTVEADSLSEWQRRFLDSISHAATWLGDMLQAVLDMARIDGGRIGLNPEPQSSIKVAAEVLEAFRALAREKDYHVTLDLPDDLPAVQADGERFKQILRILLDNAFKYTPPGGQIGVRGYVTAEMVQVDITDNGIGIPDAEQEKVFEKFFRGEAELINGHRGLGLSLYIARGLAELQGGRLWFKSREGQGSTFSFTLPVWKD